MKQLLFLIGVLLASTSVADDVGPKQQPQPQQSDLPDILLPMTPVLVEPTPEQLPKPTPQPDTQAEVITKLDLGVIYVIETKVKQLIVTIPDGYLDVKEYDVSFREHTFIGTFVDGRLDDKGKRVFDEERTVPSNKEYKYAYKIKGLKVGAVGLVLVPEGVTQRDKISSITLTVVDGSKPNPGPAPKPEPSPGPDPDPDPDPVKAENIRVCIIEDTMNRSPETAAVLNSLVGWTAFVDAGNQYRLYDKSTKEPAGVAAVAAAGTTPLPAMVVYDNKTGAMITATALPGSFSGFKTIVEGLVK